MQSEQETQYTVLSQRTNIANKTLTRRESKRQVTGVH